MHMDSNDSENRVSDSSTGYDALEKLASTSKMFFNIFAHLIPMRGGKSQYLEMRPQVKISYLLKSPRHVSQFGNYHTSFC